MTTRRLAVVADDLTGANDSAVQFARAGWRVELRLAGPADAPFPTADDGDALVVAVSADNRAGVGHAAREASAAAVRALVGQGADDLYLKVDSTVRGGVAEQVAGALAAWRTVRPHAVAVLCPAYPGAGRTVVDGHVLVDGTPVSSTPIAHDPVTPVRHSDLVSLVPGARRLPGSGGDLTETLGLAVASRASDVLVVDAHDEQDLERLGEAVAAQPAGTVLPVGSAGLAGVLARRWAPASPAPSPRPRNAPDGGVLVQVSSLHETSRRQLEHLCDQLPSPRTCVLAPDLGTVSDSDRLHVWIDQRAEPAATADVVVLVAPAERGAAEHDPTLVARHLGEITARLARRRPPRGLALVGGDGARACLDRLGATGLQVVGSWEEGVPVGLTVGGALPGTWVLTKAGGFGTDQSLTEAVRRLALPDPWSPS